MPKARSDAQVEVAEQKTESKAFALASADLPIFPEGESNRDAMLDGTLELEDVIRSVADCFPEIQVALGQMESATGKILAAEGRFDRVLSANSISQPLGFYQTYRNGISLSQPLMNGGEVYGGYRVGDGNFEPWYGERETNEAGEFKAGFSLPLLKDSAIDARRSRLLTLESQRNQVRSNANARLLHVQRLATQSYWEWVAAGQAVQIQKRLLVLAEKRVEQIKERVDSGDLAKIAQIDNDRFIAKRKNELIKAERILQKTSIKLSLFFRDENCKPVIAPESTLPAVFPGSAEIESSTLATDISLALQNRPELKELIAARQQVAIELQYARNLTLPKVDLKGFAGKDVGAPVSSKGDKTPLEMQIGVLAEVPIQRREGRGKIQVAEGKLSQIQAKAQWTADKIRAEVQDAASAVNAAHRQIAQAAENVRLTKESLQLGRVAFEDGDIDLIALNIYETSVADAELQLLSAKVSYFYYRAIYQTAIESTFRVE